MRRFPLFILAGVLTALTLSAKKAQIVLDWKPGILWETPDACNEKSPVWKETFIVLAEDNTVYHLAHTPLRRKPNVTEGKPVRWDVEEGDFYLEDEDGRVFKMGIVKKEMDPNAAERFKNGKQPCQP